MRVESGSESFTSCVYCTVVGNVSRLIVVRVLVLHLHALGVFASFGLDLP